MKYNHSVFKNGLKIISAEIKDFEIANISIWFKAGYGYESERECGYTHLFEHLLFCGTKKRPNNYAVNVEKDEIGAVSNGFTLKDQLYFLIQSGRDYIDQMLDLLSDMIRNSSLKEKFIENEKKVVMHELRKIQADRLGSANRLALENFFAGHPLAKHILISGSTVQDATHQDLIKFYKKFCIPTRAAVVVASNLTHKKVTSLCNKYFGDWSVNKSLNNIPDVKGISRINKRKYFFKRDSGPQAILSINFYAPEVNKIKENAALTLIANYLGYGFTGLLYKELRIKRGLIYDLGVSNYSYENVGQFNIWTQTNEPQKVFDIIKETIGRLPSIFENESLGMLKVQFINSLNRKVANPENLIKFLGRSFTINAKIKTPEEYIKVIKSVSQKDVINVIKKYLIPDNRYVFIQGPEEIRI